MLCMAAVHSPGTIALASGLCRAMGLVAALQCRAQHIWCGLSTSEQGHQA